MTTARTIAAGGTVSLLLALVAPASASAGCGQEYKGAPRRSAVPGGPPLAIGDSVLADAVPTLVRDGFEADGMVCRQMSQGLTILKERAGRLPRLVVLALGTNGEVTPRQIGTALELLGPQRVLVLVTPHGSVAPGTPKVIRSAAATNPQRIVLLDWDRLAAEHPDWLAPDGVHLGGAAGVEGFAAMIATTLPYATSAAPREEASSDLEPGAPVTLTAPKQHTQSLHRHPLRTSQRSARGTAAPAPATSRASPPPPTVATNPAGTDLTESSGDSGAPIAGGVAALLVLLSVAAFRHHRRSRD